MVYRQTSSNAALSENQKNVKKSVAKPLDQALVKMRSSLRHLLFATWLIPHALALQTIYLGTLSASGEYVFPRESIAFSSI